MHTRKTNSLPPCEATEIISAMRITGQNLKIKFSDFAFQIPTWSIESGQHLLIEGPSGCGKTSLLHTLSGLLKLSVGELYWGEFAAHHASLEEMAQFRRKNFGLVLQKIHLLPHLTLFENVKLGGGTPSEALRLCAELGLAPRLDHLPSQLSLGETQRAAVARALVAKPPVLFADEPTSGLDDMNTEKVMQLIQQETKNSTLILVSHDARVKPFLRERKHWQELIKI